MTSIRRAATVVCLTAAFALPLCIEAKPGGGLAPIASADAQGFIKTLIARLRGETLPAGIVKANGRIEATQVDVSSKYAGRLAEVSVEEGSSVAQGQVIARVSAPEYEAQLRAAQASVQSSKNAAAAAEAEIANRQSALEFAKSDFARGQELMKSGFITKQTFEQRKRNMDSAVASVTSFTAQRDQALSQIKNADAEVERIEAIIHDLTLVSPRNGRVQYQLARAGEVVAAGAPIVTILDLTDVYMTVFLPAADAGRVTIGDEARIILDPIPDVDHPGERQLCRGGRAIHPEDGRDQGRARQAHVPAEAQDRSERPSGLLHAGEDRHPRHGVRPHPDGCRLASRASAQPSRAEGERQCAFRGRAFRACCARDRRRAGSRDACAGPPAAANPDSATPPAK